MKFNPSNIESRVSGGTSHILPEERKKASFDVQKLVHILNGGEENTKKRKFIEEYASKYTHEHHNLSRSENYKMRLNDFIDVHKKFKNYKPSRTELLSMGTLNYGMGGLGNSHNFFLLTVIGQGTEEQQKFWVPKLLNFEITGSYVQTELGHGSNVRGIETTAVYDKNTDEFILNTPTLRSIKWWPGALGKVSTHSVILAQLIINDKEYGVNVFILQMRDENHLPLPGVNIGDLGNKIGDNSNDTGFLSLNNVRIPRANMLSKFKQVTREGNLENVGKVNSQIHYATMTLTRAMMIYGSGTRLNQASTIAIRYSCVRKQGFKSFDSGISYKSEENSLIDYKIHQYRLFKQLSYGYALKFVGNWISKEIEKMEGGELGKLADLSNLKEISLISAGLKSLCTQLAAEGIEDLRKCCGGNGYLLNSGIAHLRNEYLVQVTAEGDMAILALLQAKDIVKSIEGIVRGNQISGISDYLNVFSNKHLDIKSQKPVSAKNSIEFRNLDYLLNLFKFRALFRCFNLFHNFIKHIEEGKEFQAAFEFLSLEAMKASYSHCYYVIARTFKNTIDQINDQKIKNTLSRLFNLFALSNIKDDNWGDIIENTQFRLVNIVINDLLNEIRPDCVALTDSFDFNDYLLKSTIGRYDGNIYEALVEAAFSSTLNKKEVFDGYDEFLKPHLNKKLLSRGNDLRDLKEKF